MKILESLLPTLFITLIPSKGGVRLYAELRKNAKIIKRFEEQTVMEFKSLEKKIRHLEKECSVGYIALLETEAPQMILNECSQSETVDLSSFEGVCIENDWGVYIAKDDLFERQKAYQQIGLDFLFSPFSLLHTFYQAEHRKSDGLYLLLCDDFVIGSVYRGGKLLFGKQTRTEEGESPLDENGRLGRYFDIVQSIVKAFYETNTEQRMFVERVYIADAVNVDTRLENRLKEELFVEVEKRAVDLSYETVLLSEGEL